MPATSTKTVVTIQSTMRSGSTLLKALLAEAEDVSNLPEINFQRFVGREASQEIEALSDAPIVVLKRPCWYHESRRYPRLPEVSNLRQVLLVRDAYETVRSLKKMTLRRAHRVLGSACNRWLTSYWLNVVRRLADRQAQPGTMLVRYEDLVRSPREVTTQLFAFIGSAQATGVDTYRPPEDYQWQWGKDDGGPRIRELRVSPPPAHRYEDQALLRVLQHTPAVQALRQHLEYPPLPASR